MTAYLKPGDHVHVAVPVTPTTDTAAAHLEAKRAVAEFELACNHFGVKVASWSGHSGLHRIEVVAVFRAPVSDSTKEGS